jgi:uncharacterized membrane protein
MVAFIDETVFHQLLQWHYFCERPTTELGIILMVYFMPLAGLCLAGLFMLADVSVRIKTTDCSPDSFKNNYA